ncbi:uncharacterized protein Dvir_GJ26655 [Drosophila virilis]|uniref:Uncharacterized protein n=1 Tax=Drosophila virilis TaxID=7244 RepID=A0A0Q9WIM1_DROVI|nr:uncharacterized protein Dvir_GJ26655 [Drosophila virilis]
MTVAAGNYNELAPRRNDKSFATLTSSTRLQQRQSQSCGRSARGGDGGRGESMRRRCYTCTHMHAQQQQQQEEECIR